MTTSKIKSWSDCKLADEYGKLKAQLAPLQLQEEALKAEFDRREKERYRGKMFIVNVSRFFRNNVVTSLIEKKMGKKWLDQFRRKVPICMISVEAANVNKEQEEGSTKRRKTA